MAKKLTQTVVDKAAAPTNSVRTTIWDSEVKGYGLRVSSHGTKTFILRARLPGMKNQKVWGLGRADEVKAEKARATAISYLGLIRDGKNPTAEAEKLKSVPTVKKAFAKFNKQRRKDGLRTVDEYERRFNYHIKKPLGKERVIDVTPKQIRKLHKKIAKTAPYEANRVLMLLQALYSWLEKKGVVETNPTKEVRRKPEVKRRRYLNQEELHRLLDVLSEWPDRALANIVTLLIYTGARKMEVIKARLDQFKGLDGDGTVIWEKKAEDTKQGQDHETPLAPEVADLVREAAKSAAPDGRLFPSKSQKPGTFKTWQSRDWKKLLDAAEIEDFRLHDLRHTYASLLISNGLTLSNVGEMLGHSNTATTARYAHLMDDAQAEAASKVVDLIDYKTKRA